MNTFRARLYFFYQQGCPHCEQAKPIVARFQAAHPMVIVMHCNAQKRPGVLDFSPNGTPAYALAVGEEIIWKKEGLATTKELETVLAAAEQAFREGQVREPDDEDDIPKTRRGKEDLGEVEEEE